MARRALDMCFRMGEDSASGVPWGHRGDFNSFSQIFVRQALFSRQPFLTIGKSFGSIACLSAPRTVFLLRTWEAQHAVIHYMVHTTGSPCIQKTTQLLHDRSHLTCMIDAYLCRGNLLVSKQKTWLAKHSEDGIFANDRGLWLYDSRRSNK
jgi:hypothetical protein